ncbi:hypothetical protein [Curtobacterium sp. MCBD17_021]|nr:hypothetical protein [Curtobacterium sp. MCBD17_021]
MKETDAGLTVRYDHEPGREHFIPTKELARVGRIVTDHPRQ